MVTVEWYRPLTLYSSALNYSLGGLDPFGYHAANILLHARFSVTSAWSSHTKWSCSASR